MPHARLQKTEIAGISQSITSLLIIIKYQADIISVLSCVIRLAAASITITKH
jgi:hypothetical protein